MVRAFILFYINIKPTHGYEIQKFLQVSGTDQWTKIHSGSIYYALTKLEKDKCIKVLREERTGSRIRKIYSITESGKKELHQLMAEELDRPISIIGSMKFFTEPILSTLKKDEMGKILTNHISKLQEQKEIWEKWYHMKIDEKASELPKLSFQMTIDSLDYQIRWHQELLGHLDQYISYSKEIEQIIKSLDFEMMEGNNSVSDEEQKLQYVVKLKNEILKDPQNAVVNLDRIINELETQIMNKER